MNIIKMLKCVKKHMITIIALSLIIVAVIIIVVVVSTNKDNKDNDDDTKSVLKVLLQNPKFKRPNSLLNAEFELVEISNGMKGIIIHDPFASKSHIQFTMKYGTYIDTVPGISHFGEHMILQGSEKYGSINPIFNKFNGVKNVVINPVTSGDNQIYCITLPFNFLYEDALKIWADALRYPLYRPDIIKNEIQAVNHEFYYKIKSSALEGDIIRQLSSEKTSFNGMGLGNNETLKPSESDILSKKLKGYHMIIKNPKNIFFTLYSSKTIAENEEYAKKYLNYEMHKFPDNEIDIEDKKQLEKNIENIENIEIFDENIYKHGMYYNTFFQENKLKI